MIHKGKQIVILAAGLIALGALATWDEWKTKEDDKLKESKGLLISDIKPEDVTAIKFFSRGDSETGGDKTPQETKANSKSDANLVDITLNRKDGRWSLVTPVIGSADNQTVSDLLKNILEYKSETEVADGKDKWVNFGLETPRRKIDLETASGKKLTFFVGNNTPVGFNAYVATSNSDKVYSGSQYIATATLKSLFDLRDKKVLPNFNASDVNNLTVTQSKETVRLEKKDGAWQIVKPSMAKADTVAVNNILDDLMGLKSTEIIDQPDATLKTLVTSGKTVGQVAAEGAGLNLALRFYENKNGLYAQADGQPTVFKVNEDIKSKILKSTKDLRDKKIFSFESANIINVTIDGQEFKKIANDWYAASDAPKFAADGKFSGKPEERPTPASHVRGLVVDLEYARADDILDDARKLKLQAAPKHQVTLLGSSNTEKVVIEAWLGSGADSEFVWLKTSNSKKIYKVKKSVLASITPQAAKPPVGDELTNPIPPVSN